VTHTISERQLAANRLNSFKSCGPRSAGGKRQSALNEAIQPAGGTGLENVTFGLTSSSGSG